MNLAKVIGSVWATQKHGPLVGYKMSLIQPINSKNKQIAEPIIALDTVNSGIGNIVYYVTAYEAVIPLSNKLALCDASIVGIIDHIDS